MYFFSVSPFLFFPRGLWIYIASRFIESGSISSKTSIKSVFPVLYPSVGLSIFLLKKTTGAFRANIY
jgi:hypothetical protein